VFEMGTIVMILIFGGIGSIVWASFCDINSDAERFWWQVSGVCFSVLGLIIVAMLFVFGTAMVAANF